MASRKINMRNKEQNQTNYYGHFCILFPQSKDNDNHCDCMNKTKQITEENLRRVDKTHKSKDFYITHRLVLTTTS